MPALRSAQTWIDKYRDWVPMESETVSMSNRRFHQDFSQWLVGWLTALPTTDADLTDNNATIPDRILPQQLAEAAIACGYSLAAVERACTTIPMLFRLGGDRVIPGSTEYSYSTHTPITAETLTTQISHATWVSILKEDFDRYQCAYPVATEDTPPPDPKANGLQAYQLAINSDDEVQRKASIQTALGLLSEYLLVAPDDASVLMALGVIFLYELDETDDAEQAFLRAATLFDLPFPTLASLCWLQITELRRWRHDWTGAYDASRIVLERHPEWGEAVFQAAISSACVGNADELHTYLESAIRYNCRYWNRALCEITLLQQHPALNETLLELHREVHQRVVSLQDRAVISLAELKYTHKRAQSAALPTGKMSQYIAQGDETLAKAISLTIQDTYIELLDAESKFQAILTLCEQGPSLLYKEALGSIQQRQEELEKKLRGLAKRHQILQSKLVDQYDEQVRPLRRQAQSLSASISQQKYMTVQHSPTLSHFQWLPLAFGLGGFCMLISLGYQGVFSPLTTVWYCALLCVTIIVLHIIVRQFVAYTPIPMSKDDGQQIASAKSQLEVLEHQERELSWHFTEERQRLREEFDHQRSLLLQQLETDVEAKRATLAELLLANGEASSLPENGRMSKKILLSFNVHNRGVADIAFIPGKSLIASIGNNGLIELRDTATATVQRTLRGNTLPLVSLAVAPHGNTIAATDTNKTIHIWRYDTGLSHRTLSESANCLALNNDGTSLAAGDLQGTIRLIRLSDNSITQRILGDNSPLRLLRFTRKGDYLVATGTNHAPTLWTVVDGKKHHAYEAAGDMVSALAIAPNDSSVAIVDDCIVRVYPLMALAPLHTLQHSTQVCSLCYSASGRLLLTGGADGMIYVWSMEDGNLLEKLTDHQGIVSALAFASDQPLLASAGDDSIINLWSFAAE